MWPIHQLSLFICCTLLLPIKATTAFNCSEIFNSSYIIHLTSEEWSEVFELDERSRHYRLEIQTRRHGEKIQRVRPYFYIKQKEYVTIQILGIGNEGILLVAQSGAQLYTLKLFDHSDDLLSNLESLRKQSLIYPTLQVFDWDLEQSIAVFEFIDGIPLITLLDQWGQLSSSLKVQLSKTQIPGVLQDPHNVILDFYKGRLILVDPY
jgi:hypothetical protein